MLKVAVIGLGTVSQVHLAAIEANPNARLVAVCDIDGSKHTEERGNFYTDYQEVLSTEELDCVHICLPHHLHYQATKACVEKGVHVFQEKPLTHQLDESYELVRLAEDNQAVKICICLQNRLNETFEKLSEMIQSGQYGKVKGVKGLVTWYRAQDYYDEKPWRGQMKYAGGGVMINQSIHTLDLIQLIGGEIESIRGSVDTLSNYEIDVEDTATAKINFSNGATGLFFATIVNSDNSSVELEVTLEKGKFIIKDSVLTMIDHGEKVEIIEDAKVPGTKFYYGASHTKLINQFYDCIRNDSNDYVHPKDALTSMKMIEMIRKSSTIQKEIEF